MRVLVLAAWFPYPPINGAKIRTYNLVRQLSRFAEVDLIAQVRTLEGGQLSEGLMQLRSMCQSVTAFPAIPYDPGRHSSWQKLLSPIPDAVRVTRNRPLESAMAEAWQSGAYDVGIVTESGMPGPLSWAATRLGIRPLVLDSLELGVFRPTGHWLQRSYWRKRLTYQKARAFSRRVIRHADTIAVASTQEQELFHALGSEETRCEVVPNVVDLADYRGDFGQRSPRSLIFSGSFSYAVNYEAMLWFAQQVFPKIPSCDHLSVRVTGRTAGCDLAPIAASIPGVEFLGFVPDVRPLIAQSRISLVPILAGGSTRLKILEAMALGTPVVSTRLGAEGIEATHEEHLLLAETPAEFALQVHRLVEDDALWERLSTQGRSLVSERYSAEQFGRSYEQMLSRVAGGLRH